MKNKISQQTEMFKYECRCILYIAQQKWQWEGHIAKQNMNRCETGRLLH